MQSLQRQFQHHAMRRAIEQETNADVLRGMALMVFDAWNTSRTMLEVEMARQLGLKHPAAAPAAEEVSGDHN